MWSRGTQLSPGEGRAGRTEGTKGSGESTVTPTGAPGKWLSDAAWILAAFPAAEP